jgi:hypothetical protein
MADWIKPIYDRKQSDVDYAKTRIKYFKENGGVTDGIDLKGCFNFTDMNRIENNNQYLQDRLNELYYFCNIKNVHGRRMTSVPNMGDHISRVINNLVELQSAYYEPMLAPILPETLTHFNNVNNVEKCQLVIKEMIDDMANSFKQCGTFDCKEE